MCLYVDDETYAYLDSGTRKARKPHVCDECGRTIEPGETYSYWNSIQERGDPPTTHKMCAHCNGTLDLGCALTGCHKSWFFTMIHDLGEDGGFVGDILLHDLPLGGKAAMLRTVVARKRGWRRKDGTLFPVPALADSQSSLDGGS